MKHHKPATQRSPPQQPPDLGSLMALLTRAAALRDGAVGDYWRTLFHRSQAMASEFTPDVRLQQVFTKNVMAEQATRLQVVHALRQKLGGNDATGLDPTRLGSGDMQGIWQHFLSTSFSPASLLPDLIAAAARRTDDPIDGSPSVEGPSVLFGHSSPAHVACLSRPAA